MNYYRRHIGDYLRDTAHLSLMEHGIYCRLLDIYYTREGPIPADVDGRLVGARTQEEREAFGVVLREFFQPSAGGWRQFRCDQEIAEMHGYFAEQTTKSQLGVNARRRRSADSDPRVTHGSPTGHPRVTAGTPAGDPPTLHSPLSTTQTKIKTAEKNRSAAKTPPVEAEWLQEFKVVYPRRAGDQNWRGAARAGSARLREGSTVAEFLAGAARYAAFCVATAKAGTEFVKQAATFLGPGRPFLEAWAVPGSRADAQRDANIAESQRWLSAGK